jgi:hypothetical protein
MLGPQPTAAGRGMEPGTHRDGDSRISSGRTAGACRLRCLHAHLRPAAAASAAAAAAAASAAESEPSAEYLATLLLYYEEEIEGEAYFHDYATKLADPEQRRKMHLMGDVERHAADSVAPLLRKHGLTPRSDAELQAHATAEWSDEDVADWTPTLRRWLKRFPGYIDDFEGLEALAPEGDLPALVFLTEHEHAAIRFLDMEVGPSASSASRSASGAELEEYLGSTPEMLALQQRSASQ